MSDKKYFRIEFTGEHNLSKEEFLDKICIINKYLTEQFGENWCLSQNFNYDLDVILSEYDDDEFEREQYYREEFED